jgi:uncharacterized membrane protein
MYRVVPFILLVLIALPGCRTTRTVAAGTARVVTAPAHYVTRKIRGNGTEYVETTQVYEGQPVEELAPPPPPQVRATQRPVRERERFTTTTVTPPPTRERVIEQPTSTPEPRSSAPPATAEFPVAKPVPGKPGYVYSPFDGTMIDVTGFNSGAKAKDPATNKIFVVP